MNIWESLLGAVLCAISTIHSLSHTPFRNDTLRKDYIQHRGSEDSTWHFKSLLGGPVSVRGPLSTPLGLGL